LIFRRKREEPRKLTGARAVLKASHRDQATGRVHEHEWEITAWFPYTGTSAEIRLFELRKQLERLEGTCLADRIAWAEPLAEHIARGINTEWACYGASDKEDRCVAVEIVRHKEGLLGGWVQCTH
jgi:hypothetical protein